MHEDKIRIGMNPAIGRGKKSNYPSYFNRQISSLKLTVELLNQVNELAQASSSE